MLIGKSGKRVAATIVRRAALGLATLLSALAGGLSLGSTPALAICPNEGLRTGLSASLPDCRAYEMVSPPDKNGHSVQGGSSFLQFGQAAAGGGAVSYEANGAFPGAATGALGTYISSRGPGGWSTYSPLPPQTYSYSFGALEVYMALYSSDLSKGILEDPADSPPLVEGEQETGGSAKVSNLFLRDNATDSYSLINFSAAGLTPAPYDPTLDGASADLGTVIFNAPAALTPEAPGGGVDNLYTWTGGVLSLVSQVPPAGQASCGPAGPACVAAPHGGRFGGENAGNSQEVHPSGNSIIGAISSDGSRVFFTTAEGNLYVRESGERTVQVDASQAGGPGGGGIWATAAGDGSLVFFFDDASAGLTSDTVAGSGRNLYSYDTSTGVVTDLTPGPNPGVVGVANQASEDGAYLYFLANGVLTTAPNSLEQSASPGSCGTVPPESCNLYLFHDGAISFVHAVSGFAAGRIGGINGSNRLLQEHSASRVSPDGRHLSFFAEGSGSGGGSSGSNPKFRELFEYSADSSQVSHLCACDGSEFNAASLVSATMPQALYLFRYPRNISDDGTRIFFESLEPLLPGDTNGKPDVYQWEAQGKGTCGQPGGCLGLISSGTSTEGSFFLDASASGDDVFFATLQQIASSDIDGAFDLYDARVEGGFPAPPKPPECFGDACLNVPPAPIDTTPASLTFAGAGNLLGRQGTPLPAVKSPPTNALAKALKACAKQRKRQRKPCKAQARRRYAKKTGSSARARHANVNRTAGA